MRRLGYASSFRVICVIVNLALFSGLLVTGDERKPDEQRLIEKIMNDYESSARPQIKENSTLDIGYTFRLNQIIDLDERKQILTTNVYLEQEWTDLQLKWDLDEYGGVRTFRAPAERVWLPDTYIFNNADEMSSGFIKGLYVLLKHTGVVSWPVPIKLKTTCRVDVRFFPFDRQVCRIIFGSWIYNSAWLRFLDRKNVSVDLSEYTDNSEWILDKADIVHRIRPPRLRVHADSPQYDCVAILNVRRRSFFYIWNVVVPCIMLTLLTLFTFWTPPTSGEKITLGLSIFLAFSMFMLLIAEQVPPTSESVPLIGVYLTTVMSMTATSVIMGVLVVNLHARGENFIRAPLPVRWVCVNMLAKILCIQYDIRGAAIKKRVVASVFECHQPTREERMEALDKKIKLFQDWENKLRLHTLGCPSTSTSDKVDESYDDHTRYQASEVWVRRTSASNAESIQETPRSVPRRCPDYNTPPSPVWVTRSSGHDAPLTRRPGRVALMPTIDFDPDAAEKAARSSVGWLGHLRDRISSNEEAEQRHRAKVDADPSLVNIEELDRLLKDQSLVTAEWTIIANVIDRCLFWLFLVGTILAYVLTFTLPYWGTGDLPPVDQRQ